MRFGNFLDRFGAVTWLAAFPAEKIVDAITCDATKPRTQFVALTQMPEMFPCGDERFLRQIYAVAAIARGAVSQRTYERLIARNDLAEGVAIACKAADDQIRVIVIHRRCR